MNLLTLGIIVSLKTSTFLVWIYFLDSQFLLVILSSSFSVFSEALTYFLPGPINWCLFGYISFFSEFWNLGDVDISFRCSFLYFAVRTVYSVPSMAVFGCSFYFLYCDIFWFFFKKRIRILEVNGCNRLFFNDFWDKQMNPFLFLPKRSGRHLLFSLRPTSITISLSGTGKFNVARLEKELPFLLKFLVGSVFGSTPWRNSIGVTFSPVTLVRSITLKARSMPSVNTNLLSKLAVMKISRTCLARSTTHVQVCSVGELYCNWIFLFLLNSL